MTLSQDMTWRAARAFTKVLDAAGCTWTATAEGRVQTMDDRQCHRAEDWAVESFYRRGVVMRIDGASVRAQPGDGATVRVTVKGWAP